MMITNGCVCASRNTFANVDKVRKLSVVAVRYFFNWGSGKAKDTKSNQEPEEIKKIYGIDDENFTKVLKKGLLSPKQQKEGFIKFMSHFKRFYDEEIAPLKISDIGNFEIEDQRTKVRILHKFETEEDLKGFSVLTDSTYMKGYSSASFKLTENETGLFTGNLCKDIPKTGDVGSAGYANLQFPKQPRAFFRYKCYDWSSYNHMVFKVRGDGRTYMILLHTPSYFKETQYWQYCASLYTRGGPYWQIAKIPFNYFFLIRKGRINDTHTDEIPLENILHMSITAAAYQGPFKLEIDYIGLEQKEYHKHICPYENYKIEV